MRGPRSVRHRGRPRTAHDDPRRHHTPSALHLHPGSSAAGAPLPGRRPGGRPCGASGAASDARPPAADVSSRRQVPPALRATAVDHRTTRLRPHPLPKAVPALAAAAARLKGLLHVCSSSLCVASGDAPRQPLARRPRGGPHAAHGRRRVGPGPFAAGSRSSVPRRRAPPVWWGVRRTGAARGCLPRLGRTDGWTGVWWTGRAKADQPDAGHPRSVSGCPGVSTGAFDRPPRPADTADPDKPPRRPPTSYPAGPPRMGTLPAAWRRRARPRPREVPVSRRLWRTACAPSDALPILRPAREAHIVAQARVPRRQPEWQLLLPPACP